jgi:hypothetical protein
MPRPKSIERTEPVKVYLTPQNAAWVRLATTSSLTGRTVHGEISTLINKALEQYRASLQTPTS